MGVFFMTSSFASASLEKVSLDSNEKITSLASTKIGGNGSCQAAADALWVAMEHAGYSSHEIIMAYNAMMAYCEMGI